MGEVASESEPEGVRALRLEEKPREADRNSGGPHPLSRATRDSSPIEGERGACLISPGVNAPQPSMSRLNVSGRNTTSAPNGRTAKPAAKAASAKM